MPNIKWKIVTFTMKSLSNWLWFINRSWLLSNWSFLSHWISLKWQLLRARLRSCCVCRLRLSCVCRNWFRSIRRLSCNVLRSYKGLLRLRRCLARLKLNGSIRGLRLRSSINRLSNNAWLILHCKRFKETKEEISFIFCRSRTRRAWKHKQIMQTKAFLLLHAKHFLTSCTYKYMWHHEVKFYTCFPEYFFLLRLPPDDMTYNFL